MMASVTGFLGGLAAGAANATSTTANATSTIQDILENSGSGLALLQGLVASWLKLDLTTLAAVVTIFGTISRVFETIQKAAIKLYWWITRFLTSSISIAGRDRLNKEVLNWVGANILTRKLPRILTATSGVIQNEAWHYRRLVERDDRSGEKRQPVQYLPTFGTTWFFFQGRLFVVKRVSTAYSAENVPDEYATAPEGDEPLIVMCIGRSVVPIQRFLDACRDFADDKSAKYITVRVTKSVYRDETWDTTILKPIRPLETVHFDETFKADLVKDVRNYLDPRTRQFYSERGIPYRRGYLLHGPPGTGKTSLSLALAGHFGMELYLLHLPSVQEDTELEKQFTALPPRCIVVLEDIDAVGLRRDAGKLTDSKEDKDDKDNDDDDDDDDDDEERRESRLRSRCTLAGLLNVLDGVASQEGRIVLMTSNHADKLDSALVRPGRIDRMIYLGHISQRSSELMFMRMYAPDPSRVSNPDDEKDDSQFLSAEEVEKLAVEFGKQIPEGVFTPAMLQGYLLSHRGEPTKAVAEIADWVATEKLRMEEAAARQKMITDRRRKKRREERRKALATTLALSHNIAMLTGQQNGEKEKTSEKGDEESERKEKTKGKAEEPAVEESDTEKSTKSEAWVEVAEKKAEMADECAVESGDEEKKVKAMGTSTMAAS